MQTDKELLDLGVASEETRGMWHVGPEDVSTGAHHFIGGIASED